jgi:uncharacterized protein (DUF924 family)
MSSVAVARVAAAVPRAAASPAEAVVAFWREAGPDRWFAKDPAFDAQFRGRFLAAHEAAARGELMRGRATPDGALALVLLLDQFPRNAFRNTPRMYATDGMARLITAAAIDAGQDLLVEAAFQRFFYLPFAHSEDIADQERCVALIRRIGEPDLSRAEHHRGIIQRFGRFPHRNAILGRVSTAEELGFLDEGGYAG